MDIDKRFKGYINKRVDDGYIPITGMPEDKEEKTIDEWSKNALPILSDYNITLVNKTSYAFLKIMLILCLLAILLFGYLFFSAANDNKFKSEVNQNITVNNAYNNTADIRLNAPTTNNNDINLNPTINLYQNVSIKVDKILCNST